MINRLAEVRKSRGVAAAALAAEVGITRQAIYAIEAGTYMPNTVVALRLARVLETSVEDLFALEARGISRHSSGNFRAARRLLRLRTGRAIQICRVGKRAIGVAPPSFPAWLPLADGIVTDSRHASVTLDADDTAGC